MRTLRSATLGLALAFGLLLGSGAVATGAVVQGGDIRIGQSADRHPSVPGLDGGFHPECGVCIL